MLLRILITLFCLCFASPVWAQCLESEDCYPQTARLMVVGGGVPAPPAGCAFDLCEDFNDTTEDVTWTELPANWDDDYTTSPIEGAQMLEADRATAGTLTTEITTARDSFYIVFKTQIQSCTSNGTTAGIKLLDASDTVIVGIRFLCTNTTPDDLYSVRATYPGDTTGCSNAFAAGDAGVIFAKLKYIKSSGANDGVVTVWAVSDDQYAIDGWASADTCGTTTNTNTEQVKKIQIHNSATNGLFIDHIRGDDSDTVDY